MSCPIFSGRVVFTALLGLLAGVSVCLGQTGDSDFFERKIRPVLADQCYECHGSESAALKGGLRLDTRDGLLKGGESGAVVSLGKPSESLLIKALRHVDPKLAMPHKKPKLPEAVLVDFERWISEGAVWTVEAAGSKPKKFDIAERKAAQAWLWQSPRPQVVPKVHNTAWPLSPIDHFILAALERHQLEPASPVDDRTWLRRVSFAITGLPPSLDEIREFLADTQPGARGRWVDRLLSSPHYGERWARHWMDLVRYAESRGHESDFHIANAWHYRDYLIRAFNTGVPYDQFLMEHLAGDLLPRPRLQTGSDRNESVLGTGWAFLGEEVHSPVDIRQDECDRLDNKVDVFTKTFLGLTVACARCHDHKFDPISTQDYYALSGFFLGSSYRQVRFDSMENHRAVGVELRELRAREMPRLAAEVAGARAGGIRRVGEYLIAAGGLLGKADAAPSSLSASSNLDPERLRRWTEHLEVARTNSAAVLHGFFKAGITREKSPSTGGFPPATRVLADYRSLGQQPWKVDGEAFGSRPVLPGENVPGTDPTQPISRVMTYGAARRDPFWNRLALVPGNEGDSGSLAATARAGQMLRTPTFTLHGGKLHYLIRGRTRVYAAVDSHLMVAGPLHGRLVQSFNVSDAMQPRWVTQDLSPYTNHRAHLEFGPEGTSELEVLMVVESPEVPTWKPLQPWLPGQPVANVDEFARAFERGLGEAVAWLKDPQSTQASASMLVLADWLVRNPALLEGTSNEAVNSAGEAYLLQEKTLAQKVKWESRTAVAWFDGTGVDESVLVRGKPFKLGPLAPRSLPTAFGNARPLTNSATSGRYELGLQLVDPENPLVARVMVNRVWHHLFGRGIVPSVDNFGALGERPTHPELLDHLAWHFVHEDQWSLKRLIKRLVLTQTYAMSHRPANPRANEIDPVNALWHCVPIRRLEAEAIRDSLLAISGRLDPALGGTPIPVHLTEFVVGRGRPDQSGPLDGAGRRSLYTAVRRNFLPTTLVTFDSPTPFSTVGRRNVTNVPAQSLALMNDPLFHQQARVWAQRLMRELPGADTAARIAWLFETAYGRPPSARERATCESALSELKESHGVGVETVDVWTDLCHALINANDFIYVL